MFGILDFILRIRIRIFISSLNNSYIQHNVQINNHGVIKPAKTDSADFRSENPVEYEAIC
jgi:hypothetical protein